MKRKGVFNEVQFFFFKIGFEYLMDLNDELTWPLIDR
jgi:hypothetical protein